MSAGDFLITTYEATYADQFHPIRVQEETLLASVNSVVNAIVGAVVTNPIQARVSGSRRSIGLIARRIRLQLAENSNPPDGGYSIGSRTVIPAVSRAFYQAATKGATVTYLGTAWVVTGRVAEVPE